MIKKKQKSGFQINAYHNIFDWSVFINEKQQRNANLYFTDACQFFTKTTDCCYTNRINKEKFYFCSNGVSK